MHRIRSLLAQRASGICLAAAVGAGLTTEPSRSKQLQPSLADDAKVSIHHDTDTAKVSTWTPEQQSLPAALRTIVGDEFVEKAVVQTGARVGKGEAFAVVHPGTLQAAIDALQACVDAGCAVIPQGANTGLTGGSVPRPLPLGTTTSSDTTDTTSSSPADNIRPTVVLNMRRLAAIQPIDCGDRLVCLAGAGIADARDAARKHGRESHSVLGSIFLNPSVAAGLSLGSGGTQCRKGPVFTERVLYARVGATGQVEVVDSLGLELQQHDKDEQDKDEQDEDQQEAQDEDRHAAGDDADRARARLFRQLERGSLGPTNDVLRTANWCALQASDTEYGRRLCDAVAAGDPSHGHDHGHSHTHGCSHGCSHDHQNTSSVGSSSSTVGSSVGAVARCNADTRGPEPVRSEGKVLVLASVHDTFPAPLRTRTLVVSCADFGTCCDLRERVCLARGAAALPRSCEYMNGGAFEVVDEAGRGACLALRLLGAGKGLTLLYAAKTKVDAGVDWLASASRSASRRLSYSGAAVEQEEEEAAAAADMEESVYFCDRLLYHLNGLFPAPLPPALMAAGRDFGHHVLITVGEYDEGEGAKGHGQIKDFCSRLDAFAAAKNGRGTSGEQEVVRVHVVGDESCCGGGGGAAADVDAAEAAEAAQVDHFRFCAAGAFRTWCVGRGLEGISTDYALPAGGRAAPPALDAAPSSGDDCNHRGHHNHDHQKQTGGGEAASVVAKRMIYAHFACNVFHDDIAFLPGADPHAQHLRLKRKVEGGGAGEGEGEGEGEGLGGRLPAEHGHGTEYSAPAEVRARWRAMDPLNVMNPGIGGTSAKLGYAGDDGEDGDDHSVCLWVSGVERAGADADSTRKGTGTKEDGKRERRHHRRRVLPSGFRSCAC